MNITSDTLFHFTNSRKNLESILEFRFHPTYCQEDLTFGKLKERFYFPMISFCDIPLAMSKNIIGSYGNYGIGMTKEWGIRNLLNPVQYVEKNSQFAIEYEKSVTNLLEASKKVDVLLKSLEKNEIKYEQKIIDTLKEYNVYSKMTFEMLRYFKNYQNDLIRKNKTIPNYRFYNEREWRYVPDKDSELVEDSLNKEKYKKYRTENNSKPLLDKIKLDFVASDIKYIIVKSEKDISKLIRKISSIEKLTNSADETDVLITKILTVEQLQEDF